MYPTSTSCPTLGRNWAPYPVPAHAWATRSQADDRSSKLPARSQWNCTLTRPSSSVSISSPWARRRWPSQSTGAPGRGALRADGYRRGRGGELVLVTASVPAHWGDRHSCAQEVTTYSPSSSGQAVLPSGSARPGSCGGLRSRPRRRPPARSRPRARSGRRWVPGGPAPACARGHRLSRSVDERAHLVEVVVVGAPVGAGGVAARDGRLLEVEAPQETLLRGHRVAEAERLDVPRSTFSPARRPWWGGSGTSLRSAHKTPGCRRARGPPRARAADG